MKKQRTWLCHSISTVYPYLKCCDPFCSALLKNDVEEMENIKTTIKIIKIWLVPVWRVTNPGFFTLEKTTYVYRDLWNHEWQMFKGIDGSFSLPLERRGLGERLGRAEFKTNGMMFFLEPDLPNSLSKNTVDSKVYLRYRREKKIMKMLKTSWKRIVTCSHWNSWRIKDICGKYYIWSPCMPPFSRPLFKLTQDGQWVTHAQGERKVRESIWLLHYKRTWSHANFSLVFQSKF